MLKKPFYSFEGLTSIGVDRVPINGVIAIEDHDGYGHPDYITLVDNVGIDATTTIAELYTMRDNWTKMGGNDFGEDTNEPSGFVREAPISMGIMEFSQDGILIQTIGYDSSYSERSDGTFYDGTSASPREYKIMPVKPIDGGDGTYVVYVSGTKRIMNYSQSVILNDESGVHFIYHDTDAVIQASTTLVFSYFEEAPITCLTSWNKVTQKCVLFGDERHGITMDGMTHRYLHLTEGARYYNGMEIQGLVAGEKTYEQVSSGLMFDEDLDIPLYNMVDIPFFYQIYDPGSMTNTWYDSPSDNNVPFYNGSAFAQYNPFIAGEFVLHDIELNDVGIVFFIATNNRKFPYVKFLGNLVYADHIQAKANIDEALQTLVLGGLPSPEFCPVGAVLIDKDGLVIEQSDGKLYSDLRTITVTGSGVVSGTASYHPDLLLRNDPFAHPATAIDFDPETSALTQLTVQRAIDELEPMKVNGNILITGGTHTKITYDEKGLITAGVYATTVDISDTFDKRYVHDQDVVNLANLTGINTGDQISSDFVHDSLSSIPVNDHIDWTLDYSATDVIHAGNYIDTIYTLPVSDSGVLGGVLDGTDITIDASGNVSVNDNSHNHLWTNITSTPTTLAGYNISDNIVVAGNSVTLTGDVSGTDTFLTNGNISITTTIGDDTHNHTALTGVTSIVFAAEASDYASISTTIDGTHTYFDFLLTDDNNNDLWRWIFDPSGDTLYNAMTLTPSSSGNADLYVSGTITADSFTGTVIGNADTATNAGLLDNIDSTGFARLGITTQPDNYLYLDRTSTNPVFYVRQAGTGDIASFFTNATASSTSGTGMRITNDGSVIIDGNLTVSGTTTTINTDEVNIADNFILLNSDYTTISPTENAGITVHRGGDASNPDVSLRWNESSDVWEITSDGVSYFEVITTDSALDNEQIEDIIGAKVVGSGDVNVTYNDTTGDTTVEYTHPSYDGDDLAIDTTLMSGATVISDLNFNVTTDALGHVTDTTVTTLSYRDITPGDIGALAVGAQAVDADTVDGQHAHEMSWGHQTPHVTYTDFNVFANTDKFGGHFISGTTNGPAVNGATNYYHTRYSLGSDYEQYSAQMAFGRNVTEPYIMIRYEENSVLGAWQKIQAGKADYAATVLVTDITTNDVNYPVVWHANNNTLYDTVSKFTFNPSTGNLISTSFQGSLTGNADTATTAAAWTTPRTITLGGDLSGNITIDGSQDVTLTAEVVNDSHTHDDLYVELTGDTMTGDLTIQGALYATSKSFRIAHPLDEDKLLTYGSLEGPENGVYIRGNLSGSEVIVLPDYWFKLVDLDSITVQLTPKGKFQKLYVKEILADRIYVGIEGWFKGVEHIKCSYTVYAERKDVDKLKVES